MNTETYENRPRTLRRPGGRLEAWLLGAAATLIVGLGAIAFLLAGLSSRTDSAFIEALSRALALAWLFIAWPVSGGLVISAVFVFIRRKLAG